MLIFFSRPLPTDSMSEIALLAFANQNDYTILVYTVLYSLHKMDLYQHIKRVYHRCDQCLWLWICALSENLTHKDYICRGHVNCLVLRCHLLHILAEFCHYTLTDIMIHACDMSLLSRARFQWRNQKRSWSSQRALLHCACCRCVCEEVSMLKFGA